MGEYANFKRKQIERILNWLSGKNKSVNFKRGGKHQLVVLYPFWKRPYPIPFKHNEINKHIVKGLMEKLVNSDICTKEEFDEHIK